MLGVSLLLVGVDFLDELSSGVPVVGAPGIRDAFALRYSSATLLLFVVPRIVALVLEPPIYVLADRRPRRQLVVGGLVAMAACDLVAGLSTAVLPFAVALALTAAASGVGVNLAQATLVDRHPAERERMMTLWSLAGMGGDLAAPAFFWVLSLLALGWRTAFVISAAVLFVYAALLSRGPFPAAAAGEEQASPPPVRVALRAAFGNRALLRWLGGVVLCGLLDEILVAFAAMHMRDRLGLDAGERSLVLMAFVAGGIAGLAATERLLRRGADPMALLRASGAACAVAYGAWIGATTPVASAWLMAAVGLVAAPLYPIAQAQAYRALPGQSGMVNAVSAVLAPLEIALPLLLGLVADRWGLEMALAALAAQPLGLLALGLRPPRGAGRDPEAAC